MAAEELIKKGRKAAAAFLKAQCSNVKCPDLLNELLDIFLNPEKPISDQESIEWIVWLIAGGKTPDDFCKTVKTYDSATTCGLVWTANFVAYRCRTCGISPCMSLCAECFQKGNHDGHDFNMFRSQAGGACDCGDTSVMKATGFCPRHGPKVQNEKPPIPSSLICMAEAIIPRTILRLIQHFREAPESTQEMEESNAVGTATPFILMLQKLIEMGTAMRKVVTRALIDPEVYKLADRSGWELYTPSDNWVLRTKRISYFNKSYTLYEEAKKALPTCSSPPEYQHLRALKEKLEHSTFLEELMFWTVKMEFPQDLVCFLLNLLIEPEYKEAFTRTFVAHYARASVMLARTSVQGTAEHLAHRVVHVSVQLFSNEELALRMHHELHLLHVMVISLRFMIAAILTPSNLTSNRSTANNFHLVVDCTHRIMQDHTYWPLVSDLNNVLTHRQVALEFLAANDLVEMWFSFLTMFQAMNVNQREMALHLEYEPKSYYGAFSAELESSATPMWALISHLSSQDYLSLTDKILKSCLTALIDWFDSIDFTENDKPSAYQMTFHLPLHRYYAMFICQAVLQQNATLSTLLPGQSTLKMLIMHPLHTLAAFFEILNGLWVRNGVQIKGQSMTYIQCHFCNSMVDADICLQQLCCGHLDPDWFLETLLNQFHVWDWFSFRLHHLPSFLEPEQVMPMLEGALTLIALICSLHNNLGMTESEVTKQEMVSLLCMADRTHSQLLDMLPEKCGTLLHNKDFETILQQIADYKGPNFEIGGNMVQGTYVPKPLVWENDFDPIHVSLRALHRKDYQASLDRYAQYIKQSGKFNSKGNLWPPYRIPGPVHPQFVDPRNILHSKTFHAIIFILLYRALNEHEIPDKVISLTIHLLELAVKHPYSTEGSSGSDKVRDIKEEVPDLKFHAWFSGSKTLDNVFTTVKSIAIPQPPQPVEDMDYNENITAEQSEPEAYEELPTPKGRVYKRKPDDQKMQQETSSPEQDCEVKMDETWTTTEDRSPQLIVDIDESIVSLLLKLHSKYTGKADSFRLKKSKEREESRIGDAPHFIGLILSHLAALYGDQTIQVVQQQIWPWRVADSPVPQDPVQDRKDIENRRRLARERQQKVMEEFAIKQKVFMQAMETELSEAEAALLPSQREYECVICSQPSTSTPERPIAMVVLVQATSTLGHSRLPGQEGYLPMDQVPLNTYTRASYYDQVIQFLAQHFDESSWQMGINIGWKGGVHIQSCGHYLHMDCHQSYLESLRSQNSRQQNLAVDRGEYACPLCRQLANSVLPIIVQHPPSPSTSGTTSSLEEVALQINQQLNAHPQLVSEEFSNVAAFMEDVTKITDSQFRSYIPEPTQNSLFLFVCSLARINLEIDLLQKLPKKSCFVPLFRVLALHAKVLCSREPFTPLWSQLTGLPLPDGAYSTPSVQNKMPLLVKDPISLLILFSLILPAHFDKAYYTCIVQVLYNLLLIQSLARMYSQTHFSILESQIKSNHWLAELLPLLKPLYSYLEATEATPSSSTTEMNLLQDLELRLKENCLPFLRVASLLQSYLYSQPSCPDDGDNGGKGADELRIHLGLDKGLRWPPPGGLSIVGKWVQELIAASGGLTLPWPEHRWACPRLLRLPPHYDHIFQHYHRRPCTVCQRIPQDSALCLVCATLVCLREKCCRQQNRYEALTHALSCGAGTAMFLLINASTIIVIRGKRACLWGSVYLDSYGEEDRDLKRGKPLYLSEARYELLEQQWLQHSFDHTSKRWVWHKDNL